MGFLDKAKKMAEQAQEKLDEVQKDFNAKQGGGGQQQQGQQHASPGSGYDQHGRRIQDQTPETPADLPATQSADLSQPKGDPLSAEPTAPAATPTQGDPAIGSQPAATTPATPTSPDPAPNKNEGDPLLSGEDASRHGRDADRGEAPKTPGPREGFTSGDPLGG